MEKYVQVHRNLSTVFCHEVRHQCFEVALNKSAIMSNECLEEWSPFRGTTDTPFFDSC